MDTHGYDALHRRDCHYWEGYECDCGMSAAIRALASDDPLDEVTALLAREEV